MNKEVKIEGTTEAWESGALGCDKAHVRVAKGIDRKALDESLDLQMISIRLQKSLIEEFKGIAKLRGLGYQPLMRQVLTRFVEAEKKQLLIEAVLEAEKKEKASQEKDEEECRDCA